MMPRSPRGVLCLCGLMAVLSVAAVGSTLSGTSAHLDPRLDGECRFDAGPVPGGSLLCPRCGRELLPSNVDMTRPNGRTSGDVGVR